MATLTATELANLRLLSGDDCTPYIVTDAQIQVFNDSVSASECATVALIIRARWAAASHKTGIDQTSGAAIANPALSGLKDLYESWKQGCVEALPAMGSSLIDLGIDEEIPETG